MLGRQEGSILEVASTYVSGLGKVDNIVSRSQTLYLKKQRGKGLVKLPWQIGSLT